MVGMVISINTYNRPEGVQRTVDGARKLWPAAQIWVFDDCSDKELYLKGVDHYVRLCPNKGKHRHYEHWNEVVRTLPDAEHYLFLPDDVDVLDDCRLQIATAINMRVQCLNLITEDRALTGCWQSGPPVVHGPFLVSGWWDCCGYWSREAMNVMRRDPLFIHRTRWKRDKRLGSGVGRAISLAFRRAGITMYQSRGGAVSHLGQDSQMNPQARKDHPMNSVKIPEFVGGMATIPGRLKECVAACRSVLPFLDNLYLVLNDYETVPDEIREVEKESQGRLIVFKNTPEQSRKFGDAMKFAGLVSHRHITEDFIYFTFDDDIEYPADYVSKMARKVEHYDRRVIAGVHGKVLPDQVQKFYGGHSVMYHTASGLANDRPINCIGTGTCCAHNLTLKGLTLATFETANMADIWLSMWAHSRGIPAVAVSRPSRWLRILDIPESETIYGQHKNAGEVQTMLWNGHGAHNGWEVLKP